MATATATANKAKSTAAKATPKAPAKPSKKYDVIKLDKLAWHIDPTTGNGEWAITVATVGEYLTSMGVWDGTSFDSSRIITTEAQRTILRITPTGKKAKMMKHVLRAGPVPTVIMTVKGNLLSPLDGLQRGDVHTQVAQALLMRKHDPEAVLPSAAADSVKKLAELGHDITDLDTFLAAPMKVEIWRGLTVHEEDAKFGTWNLDATPISTKHMAEILHSDLRERIAGIGIKTITEKEAKTPVIDPATGQPVSKPRKKKDDVIPPEDVVRSLASVQVSLYGYLTGMRGADKSSMLDERAHGKIHDRWAQLGNETVSQDMAWFFLECLPAMHKKYDESDSPAGKQVKSESETLIVPALAALGWARQENVHGDKIRDWKDSVMDLLSGEEADPLGLFRGVHSWSNVRDGKDLKGSTGQKDRKLTFYGWRNAITKGLPFNWEDAFRDACNA